MTAYAHSSGDLLALDQICAVEPPGTLAARKARWFADMMQAGEEFPPIRVRSWASGKFNIIDGAHRFAACVLAKFSHIPTVVEAST